MNSLTLQLEASRLYFIFVCNDESRGATRGLLSRKIKCVAVVLAVVLDYVTFFRLGDINSHSSTEYLQTFHNLSILPIIESQ